MTVTLGAGQLAALFPAYLLVDGEGRVRSVGPTITGRFPQIIHGTPLAEHFRVEPADWARATAQAGDDGRPVRLFAINTPVQLGGSALAVGDGILLAVNLMPSVSALETGDVSMSDFAPADPAIPALMLVALQQQMLDDAARNAQELERERKHSAELWQRISRVAGHMAHDFANVFSIITLNARRLVNEGRLGAGGRRLVRMIEKTVERGSGATHALMTMARQEHDTAGLLLVDGLIGEQWDFLGAMAGPRVGLVLALGSPGVICRVSRSGLIEGLVDLIVHGRDSLPVDSRISIGSRVVEGSFPGERMLQIRVGYHPAKDVGWLAADGIAGLGGAGSSLLGVRELARACGGAFIEAPDLSWYALHLPISSAADVQDDAAKSQPSGRRAAGERIRVLVLEDEPFALEALTELLIEDGFSVTPCATFAAALSALQAGSFDVILSDVVLPCGNGIDLCRQVAVAHPAMRVILMSGYVPDGLSYPAGWCFLRKPLDVASLRRLVRGF